MEIALLPQIAVKTEEPLNGRDNLLSPRALFSLSCQKGIYSRPKVNLPAPHIPFIETLLGTEGAYKVCEVLFGFYQIEVFKNYL